MGGGGCGGYKGGTRLARSSSFQVDFFYLGGEEGGDQAGEKHFSSRLRGAEGARLGKSISFHIEGAKVRSTFSVFGKPMEGW